MMDPVVSLKRPLSADFSVCLFCQTKRGHLRKATSQGIQTVSRVLEVRKKRQKTTKIEMSLIDWLMFLALTVVLFLVSSGMGIAMPSSLTKTKSNNCKMLWKHTVLILHVASLEVKWVWQNHLSNSVLVHYEHAGVVSNQWIITRACSVKLSNRMCNFLRWRHSAQVMRS